MFDIKLLKSKFYTKSKSAINMTKTRIARIKRKRKAMQKYLKNDIADLLKNGLEVNAYGRVEGLWNELNLSSCYEFVEQFCTQISTHLTTMDKQRECPDVCREAVSSLMLASSRFHDLPELRDLGNVFLQRFGTSLDHHVNKEFNNKIKSMTPPTKDMKLQVMQEIAKQSGVEWNVKNLEQKFFNPPPDERNNPDMIDQNMDKNEADYEARKNRTELSKDESVVVVPKGEIFGGCNEPSNLRTSSVEEEEEQQVVDMKPFYYKTIRLPSYKSNPSNIMEILKHNSNLTHFKQDDLHQCDSITDTDTGTRPKPKSVRTRNQKASHASVKNGPPTRRVSLPAESGAVKATKGNARTYSFRPDEMLSPKGHVHSKIPDYEDF